MILNCEYKMVDLAEIQAAYYMVAATGVLIAAVFYIFNLRISQRNQELMLKAQQQTLETRRISVVQDIMKEASSTEAITSYYELLNYQWSDYDDFERKYGSKTNPEAAAKRDALWTIWSMVGALLRKGIVGIDDIYDACAGIDKHWEKFKPIIDEYRRGFGWQVFLKDFEYLAGEIVKYQKSVGSGV
jgi:hypothetical protein